MSSRSSTPQSDLKRRYLLKAIEEYEYSFAVEYDKSELTPKAAVEGTIDFDYKAESEVEISPDGAWVKARVWVPKKWMES